jgi:syntaxin 16
MTKSTSAPAEQKMSANMKISLATRVQEMSTSFRKMQSNYLKALRTESYPIERGPSPGLYGGAGGYDPVAEDAADVAMSQSALQESSRLAVTEDINLRQREQEISKIAQGILEVAEIFRDMQTMVIDQGTLVDRIDYNIETMYTNVKGADKELIQATHYQKRTQKCKIILFLVLVIVGLIIVLILKPKRHHTYSDPAPAAPASPQPNENISGGGGGGGDGA